MSESLMPQPYPPKKPMSTATKLAIWAVVGLFSLCVLGLFAGAIGLALGSDSSPDTTTSATAEATEGPAANAPAEDPEPDMTASQEQAVGAAEDYLAYQAFSRQGLIDQLSSEYGSGFSVEDATFAVDYLNVDWNEQAKLAAEEYLEFQHFSHQGLVDQLSSEYGSQFTPEQAEYGVTAAGL